MIIIEMENGAKIELELDATAAPKTVENFEKLVRAGFYDGLTFHRVQSNFMIQGGDPKADGTGDGPRNVYGEFADNGYYSNTISHKRGVISMARGGYDMNSASCQFFITNGDASASLDGSYAAFGYVVDGMDVVDAITKSTEPFADTNKMNIIPDKTKHAVIEDIIIVDKYNID